jgi:hypothetical protein
VVEEERFKFEEVLLGFIKLSVIIIISCMFDAKGV